MPMPVPLLDVPANLERLLRSDPTVLRSNLMALIDELGPAAAAAALREAPTEAALAAPARWRPRLWAAEEALGCGKVGRGV
jgi:hypothetical protein